MPCVTFGLNWSIWLENDNEMFTIYTGKNEDDNHGQRFGFKQKILLASSHEQNVDTKMKTLFTFKFLFIDFIDHANI